MVGPDSVGYGLESREAAGVNKRIVNSKYNHIHIYIYIQMPKGVKEKHNYIEDLVNQSI